MAYILEAHPNHEYAGLFLAGNEREVEMLNTALLSGTLGAMASAAAMATEADVSPLLYHVIRDRTQGRTIRSMPHNLTAAVGAVLGSADRWEDNLRSRLGLLVDETVAGHLTSSQLLEETKILHDLLDEEPPQWLTHDGLFATFRDGSIVPDIEGGVEDGKNPSLTDYERRIAQEVGADAYVYQVAVSGNTPDITALPSILTRDHLTFGRMTPEGFDPMVTTLNMSGYGQNYPAEQGL